MENDHLTIYSGHSRMGRGPDCGPFFERYGKFPIRSGALNDIEVNTEMKYMYINSCSSTKHFTPAVDQKQASCTKPITFLSNTAVSRFGSGIGTNTRLIKSFVEARCNDYIQAVMNDAKISVDVSRIHID